MVKRTLVTASKPGGSGEDPVPTGQQDLGGEERTQFTPAWPGQPVKGETVTFSFRKRWDPVLSPTPWVSRWQL